MALPAMAFVLVSRLVRGRGRRWRKRRGTATLGTIADATWVTIGKYNAALSFKHDGGECEYAEL